ncbi:MAG: amidase family protein, partial [Acidimicrobiia bacterium]|nr:amidase family protein [Acidimicrobiia bacterium]
YPAYCCGLIGLRPTQGRVPAFNHSAPAERPPVLQMMSVQGPLTRTVDDARLALDAMAAASSWDPHHVPAPTRLAARSGPPRAAIATGPVTPAAEVRAALDQAAAHLEAGGYEVTAHEPPELERMVELWTGLLFAEMRVSGLAQLRSMASPALNSIVDAYQTDVPDIDLGGFIELLSTRLTVLRRWTRLFETYDVVVMPVSAELAIAPAEDASSAQRCREILHAQTCLVAMNVLGLPSVAVPTGVAADRTPVGVQIVADRFREDRALDAAEAIERATGPLTERLWSPS